MENAKDGKDEKLICFQCIHEDDIHSLLKSLLDGNGQPSLMQRYTVTEIAAGSNVTVGTSGNTITINSTGGGVSQIVAGTNVSISPSGGTGAVTINATGGGGGGVAILSSQAAVSSWPTINVSGGSGGSGGAGWYMEFAGW